MLMRTKYLDNLHRDSSLSYYSSAKILLTLCSLIDSKMPFEHFFDDPLYHEWLPTLDDICARNDFHWPISLANEPGARMQMEQRKTSKRVSSTHEQAYKQMAPYPIFCFCLILIIGAMQCMACCKNDFQNTCSFWQKRYCQSCINHVLLFHFSYLSCFIIIFTALLLSFSLFVPSPLLLLMFFFFGLMLLLLLLLLLLLW